MNPMRLQGNKFEIWQDEFDTEYICLRVRKTKHFLMGQVGPLETYLETLKKNPNLKNNNRRQLIDRIGTRIIGDIYEYDSADTYGLNNNRTVWEFPMKYLPDSALGVVQVAFMARFFSEHFSLLERERKTQLSRRELIEKFVGYVDSYAKKPIGIGVKIIPRTSELEAEGTIEKAYGGINSLFDVFNIVIVDRQTIPELDDNPFTLAHELAHIVADQVGILPIPMMK
jgi:hypothetical protein